MQPLRPETAAPSPRSASRDGPPWLWVAPWLLGVGCGADASLPAEPAAARTGEAPDTVDRAAVTRLRDLGYADVGEALDEDEPVGVLRWDRERARRGVNLFTNAHLASAQLIDMAGEVLHEWRHPDSFRWGNTVLTPEGDLLVVGRLPHDGSPEEARAGRYLARLAWDGTTRWQKRLAVHHDVEMTPDGRVLTMTYDLRPVPEVHPEQPLVDNLLVLLSPEGELLEEVSMWDVMTSAPEVFTPQEVEPGNFDRWRGVDALHLNAAEWVSAARGSALARRGLELGDDAVLVCLRHQDTVALLDWSERRLLWAFGQGHLSGPHDATLLEDGNVLLFDNGLGRGWSRVLEVDPITNEIAWEYHDPDPRSFFTITRGSNQRLASGNTLIADSDSGRVIEVTLEGEVVWSFQNPNLTPQREPSVIVRMRTYEGLDYDGLRERMRAGTLGKVD